MNSQSKKVQLAHSTAQQDTMMATNKPGYNEKVHFEATFDVLTKTIMEDIEQFNLPENGKAWVHKMLYYTIPGGKMNRGLTVVSSLKSLKGRDLTEDELFKAEVLGWCVELLQGFFLISDDIMDASKTRRGQPCWYKVEGVGMVAINDAFIVESVIYRLLKKYFRQEECYVDLLDLFHEVTYQTELGQLMDLLTAPEEDVDLNRFSISKHAYIVEYKTAYYSFYLPIALSMHLAGIKDENAYKQALAVLLPLGEYFQIQDDFLDCYGAPEVIGKIGTDIEDNKCSWLINQALDKASPEQRALLEQNYGQKDAAKVAAVKKIYQELDIENVYRAYEEASYKRITGLIAQIDDSKLPREMFVTFMNRIYKVTSKVKDYCGGIRNLCKIKMPQIMTKLPAANKTSSMPTTTATTTTTTSLEEILSSFTSTVSTLKTLSKLRCSDTDPSRNLSKDPAIQQLSRNVSNLVPRLEAAKKSIASHKKAAEEDWPAVNAHLDKSRRAMAAMLSNLPKHLPSRGSGGAVNASGDGMVMGMGGLVNNNGNQGGEFIVEEAEMNLEELESQASARPLQVSNVNPGGKKVGGKTKTGGGKSAGGARADENDLATSVKKLITHIEPITVAEFEAIPKYLINRLSRDKINDLIVELNRNFAEKYAMLKLPHSKMNKEQRDRFWEHKKLITAETK
ncbi:Farnesyl pyrophosphate synthetase, partial [Blyttiomyces sp. JEL0837]